MQLHNLHCLWSGKIDTISSLGIETSAFLKVFTECFSCQLRLELWDVFLCLRWSLRTQNKTYFIKYAMISIGYFQYLSVAFWVNMNPMLNSFVLNNTSLWNFYQVCKYLWAPSKKNSTFCRTARWFTLLWNNFKPFKHQFSWILQTEKNQSLPKPFQTAVFSACWVWAFAALYLGPHLTHNATPHYAWRLNTWHLTHVVS